MRNFIFRIMGFLSSCAWDNTAVWVHLMYVNKTHLEKRVYGIYTRILLATLKKSSEQQHRETVER